ncbi:MAG: VWA domain-containing protein, partial [Myxococcota bacterium]
LRRLAVAAVLLSGGCSKSLTVTRINSAEKKPNNVWVFFTVEREGEPVAGLAAEDFAIYEDEALVSTFESQQVIQNPEVAAVMYTLLLLDMSGSITESGEADAVVDAAHKFSEKVGKTQKVGAYAFDGGEDIYSVVRFTEAQGSIDGGLDGLRSYKPKDPSTNLHGAVVQGLDVLGTALEKDKRPLKFGTLVVFTDGTDRAHRVPKEDMIEALGKEEYANFEIYVIGVGAELEEGALAEIGRDGTELATDDAKVDAAFQRVASRIEQHAKRFYLLSYCTPSRSGSHVVRIEAKATDEKGKKKQTGSLSYEFEAEKFGPPPACDPQRAPTFRLDKNLTPPDADANGTSSSKGSAKAGGGKASAKGGAKFGAPAKPGSGG